MEDAESVIEQLLHNDEQVERTILSVATVLLQNTVTE